MQRVIVIELLSLANRRFNVSKTLGQRVIVILLTLSAFCVCGALVCSNNVCCQRLSVCITFT